MQHIHESQTVAARGENLGNATAAMIFLHGRGGTAEQSLTLADHLDVAGYTYLAPQASANTWYPQRFIAPREANQPHLSSALRVVDSLVSQIIEQGLPPQQIVIGGFSQGACLAVEYAARHPRRFGLLAVFSGGLIGTDDELTGYNGSLDGTPVFMGCSDIDSHIPVERVHKTTSILSEMGATVDKRIYPGMGHTINQEELDVVRSMMEQIIT